MEYTVKQIADLLGAKVIGDEKILISGINSLEGASSGEISFFADRRYAEDLKKTNASAMIVPAATDLYEGTQILVTNPALAYARIAALFSNPAPKHPGISQSAVIHESAVLGKGVSIFPLVYVGEKAVIGDRVTLFPGVFVGDRVRIGNDTVIYPNVTIMQDCLVGNEVIIHAGSVIGSDGFGFVRDKSGENVKIPQIGMVQIDDRVEIGANNCIDRAALGKTWVKRGVKTDNLVQIAHNVVIGEDTVIVAQTGIAGSVTVGRQVVMGGQVGITDHVKIADRAMIGSQSGVSKSISAGEVVSGTPAIPHRLWLKTRGLIPRLPDLVEKLRNLEKKVAELEKRSK